MIQIRLALVRESSGTATRIRRRFRWKNVPWCGTKFTRNSFRLTPNPDNPTDLIGQCVKPGCSFAGNSWLPIVAVDEPIYRRLPCFMIATVDKFAALPWTGEVGAFFGRVERYDKGGFYGPCDPMPGSKLPDGRLLPPDLIIQDELHLISGPLGTMVGLYETALDELVRHREGRQERSGQRSSPRRRRCVELTRRSEHSSIGKQLTSSRRLDQTGGILSSPRRCLRQA